MHRFQGLYGVTDNKLQPDDRILLETVEQALQGGMKVLQYRDKSLDHEKRFRQAAALKMLCLKYQAIFLINDDVDLALEVEADGVHLGQQDESLADARERLGDYAIIGISCEGSLDYALQAEAQGADYVAFGRFFPSRTKPDAKTSELSILPEAKAVIKVPVVAIGGITVDNAQKLISGGADMIAVVHSLFAAQNIQDRARELATLFPKQES